MLCAKLDGLLAYKLFKAHQALHLGVQIYRRKTPRTLPELTVNSCSESSCVTRKAAVARIVEAVLQYGLLHILRIPVGIWPLRVGQAVQQARGAQGLLVAVDLVELLAGIAHHPTGLADVSQFRSEF